jgi:hypothetical protein
VKRLLDNLMLLAVMIGAAYGLYYYLYNPPEEPEITVRYQENDQETMFHEREDAGSGLDDCYRYVNPESVQSCLDKRDRNAAESD